MSLPWQHLAAWLPCRRHLWYGSSQDTVLDAARLILEPSCCIFVNVYRLLRGGWDNNTRQWWLHTLMEAVLLFCKQKRHLTVAPDHVSTCASELNLFIPKIHKLAGAQPAEALLDDLNTYTKLP